MTFFKLKNVLFLKKTIFFAKKFAHVRKKQYFCTRFRKKHASLAQSVRASDC